MTSYEIKDLSTQNPAELDRIVQYFAYSNLPNIAFLRQFSAPYGDSVCNKNLWEGYAKVLCLRGFPQISDVASNLLVWWQDPNWPGFRAVEKLVKSNKQSFVPLVKLAIKQALNERDIGWFKSLLELFSAIHVTLTTADKNMVEDILEYLDDDTWKDFDNIYLEKVSKVIMQSFDL